MFVFVQTWGLLCYEMAMLAVKHGDSCDVRCFLVSFDLASSSQWPFQDPIDWRYLPYMLGLFFRPKFQGISPENMAKHMVRLRTSICWILENSHRSGWFPTSGKPGNRPSGGLRSRSSLWAASAGRSSLLVHVVPWKWHHYEPWKIRLIMATRTFIHRTCNH